MKIRRTVDGAVQLLEVPDDYQMQEGEELDTTPPTNNPAPPQVDNAILGAYQQQLLDEARRNADLQRRLEEAERRNQAPPSPQEEKNFFDTPVTATRDIVRAEIDRSVAPLNQFVAQQQRQATINTVKQQMRALPQHYPHIAAVEGYVDQLLSSLTDINPQAVAAAYNQAVGFAFSRGELQLTPQSTPNVPPVPPNIPRSAPPPQNTQPPRNLRKLNENEKKIARYNNMTDEQYIAWTDNVSANEVAHIDDDTIKNRAGGR